MDVKLTSDPGWPRTTKGLGFHYNKTLTAGSVTAILAIDPGSTLSAWMGIDAAGRPLTFGKVPNDELAAMLRSKDLAGRLAGTTGTVLVLEAMTPRGMPTSLQEFEATWWSGRFAEAARPMRVERIARDAVKLHLTGRRVKVTDANVRAALIDRYGRFGGKDVAIGRKASPGPLYGVADDVWAALGVACAYADDPKLAEAFA